MTNEQMITMQVVVSWYREARRPREGGPQVMGARDVEPLFRSAHQALLFAYTFSDNEHGIAAAAERQIAEFARDRYPPISHPGRGLRGLDGAAQAGMIRSRVEAHMPPLYIAAIVARFAVLSVADRQAACAALALRARTALPCPYPATVLLMRRAHGLRVNIGRMADEHDVGDRTVRRWQVLAYKWLRPIQQRAMDQAEQVLCAAGIVESATG